MKLMNFLKAVKYKITDGFEFQWKCFGSNSFCVGREFSRNNKFVYSASCVFDTRTQLIYEVTFWDYKKEETFRWIKKSFLKSYKSECCKRNISFDNSLDDKHYTYVSFDKIISIINRSTK